MMFLFIKLYAGSEKKDEQGEKVTKRTAYSLQEKMAAVYRVASCEKRSTVLGELNLPESTLRQDKDRFKYVMKNCNKKEMKERKKTRLPDNVDLDRELYQWFTSQPTKDAISNEEIIAKAQEIHISQTGNPYSRCYTGWLHRWKKRHGLLKQQMRYSSQDENNSMKENENIEGHVLTSSGENESMNTDDDSAGDTAMDDFTSVITENKPPIKTECDRRYRGEPAASLHQTADNNRYRRESAASLYQREDNNRYRRESAASLYQREDNNRYRRESAASLYQTQGHHMFHIDRIVSLRNIVQTG